MSVTLKFDTKDFPVLTSSWTAHPDKHDKNQTVIICPLADTHSGDVALRATKLPLPFDAFKNYVDVHTGASPVCNLTNNNLPIVSAMYSGPKPPSSRQGKPNFDPAYPI